MSQRHILGILIFVLCFFVNRIIKSQIKSKTRMTVVLSEAQPAVVDSVEDADEQQQPVESSTENTLPGWIAASRSSWGELVLLPEWNVEDDGYRSKHGWKVRRSKRRNLESFRPLLFVHMVSDRDLSLFFLFC
jgi:hypothetical protein